MSEDVPDQHDRHGETTRTANERFEQVIDTLSLRCGEGPDAAARPFTVTPR